MRFVDRNFRFACVDAIHCCGYLPDVFEQTDTSEIADRIALVEAVALNEDLLSKITDLAPDGGDYVYMFADPDWGAGNSDLYISQFDDLLLLPNLKSLWVHAVTVEGSLDLAILLECKSLEKFSGDKFYIRPSDRNVEIIAQLTARGVDVHLI